MNVKRNELIDRMVRLYGFGNPIVTEFSNMCKHWTQDEDHTHLLEVLVVSHEQFPIIDKD